MLKRMEWVIPGAVLALAGCLSGPSPAPAGKLTPQMRSESNELRIYQIADWIAPDDRTLILHSLDHSLLEGRFRGQCTGLRLADTIAFVVPSPPAGMQYTGIVLPDGRRCNFRSLTRLVAPAAAQSDRESTQRP
ncbi:MAG TPA: hypothetical protein VIY54_08085 [Steroidobacteraceae bacterium]